MLLVMLCIATTGMWVLFRFYANIVLYFKNILTDARVLCHDRAFFFQTRRCVCGAFDSDFKVNLEVLLL